MNFYKHHLGDYDGHTAHLTWDEDMAYTRLLRAYYRREKAIPDAEKYRLTRATTKAQRIAVDRVLSEFFAREGSEWRQKRCDEEIVEYQERATRNREIGRLGGRPKETQTVSRNNPDVTEKVPKNNPSQNQNQEPEKTKPPFVLPDWVPGEDWKSFDDSRKKLRKPMTNFAKSLVIKELDRLRSEGHDPGEVLRLAVRRGWLDVYAPKTEANPMRGVE